MRGRLTPAAALAALALVVPASASAAGISDNVAFATPTGSTQRLTVTMSDDAAATPALLFATYRAVPPGTSTTDVCAPTITTNPDARVIDGLAGGPGPYSVTRSIDLPLSLFAVCLYRGTSGGAPAALASVSVAGSFRPGSSTGGGTALPTLSLRVRASSSRPGRFVFSGSSSRRSGRVSLQRSVGKGSFRTVARTRLRSGRFTFTRTARKGERYRVALVGSKARSSIVRFR